MSFKNLEKQIQKKFNLNFETNMKDAILVDYYVSGVIWCKQKGYTSQHLSTFLSILHELLNKIKEKKISLGDLVKEFEIMLCKTCPGNVQGKKPKIFNNEQGKEIISYLHLCMAHCIEGVNSSLIPHQNDTPDPQFLDILFQHYKLYRCLFSLSSPEEVITKELSVELPPPAKIPFPPPLNEGVSEIIYNAIFTAPTPESKVTEEHVPSEHEIRLPEEMEEILSKLTPEDVKNAIAEICAEILNNFKAETEAKLKAHVTKRFEKFDMVQKEFGSQ